jgi:hypothetical protein
MHGIAQRFGGALTNEVAARTIHDDISFAKRPTITKAAVLIR